jgi:hypothetical protein
MLFGCCFDNIIDGILFEAVVPVISIENRLHNIELIQKIWCYVSTVDWLIGNSKLKGRSLA